MNSSEQEEILGMAQLVSEARYWNISLPLAILSPNHSSSMARIAKSLPIAIKASPSRDQENRNRNREGEAEASPRTPPLVKEFKRNRSGSSTPHTPTTPAVKVIKFSASKPLPEVFPREEVNVTPKQRQTSALRELFKTPGMSSPQFQRRGSHELLSIKVRAPDMDLPLSLVVPKDASVSQVIVSILHKLDGSSLTTRLDSSGFELRMFDEDEPDMGLPALSTNQQIGSFGCTTFELVKKAAALKAPSPPRVPALVAREDESGATAPLPQPAESSQARRAEPRVATASCFHFDEFSASMYKEFDVVKVNRHGFRQLRKMGIDRDKIYNLAPKAGVDAGSGGSKKSAGILSSLLSNKSGAVKKKSRLIKEVRSVDPVEGQAMSFTLVYNEKGGETSTYVFSTNTEEEAADIVARLRFLQRLHTRS